MMEPVFRDASDVLNTAIADCPLAIAAAGKKIDKPDIEYEKPIDPNTRDCLIEQHKDFSDQLGTPQKDEHFPNGLVIPSEREHIIRNPETNPEETEYQTLKAKTDQSKVTETKDIKELQAIADKAAKDYNEKYHPFERAQKKGITDVEKTSNGGVSFENSSDIYKNEKGEKAVVQIKATGSRSKDFDAANKAAGLKETPDGYVWHHRDDYDVKTNTFTLELVKEDTHNSTKPHSGGCAQYDAVHGSTYNR